MKYLGKGVVIVRKWVVWSVVVMCSQLHAAAAWFTVTGNSRNPAVDTVDVDPVALGTAGELRTMNVRVSRAAQRKNWEGVPYRSYESQVAFNCRARKAHYVVATFYMAPLWQGVPHQSTDYAADPRPMLFKDMDPNPTERIVRAACRMTS